MPWMSRLLFGSLLLALPGDCPPPGRAVPSFGLAVSPCGRAASPCKTPTVAMANATAAEVKFDRFTCASLRACDQHEAACASRISLQPVRPCARSSPSVVPVSTGSGGAESGRSVQWCSLIRRSYADGTSRTAGRLLS